MNVKKKLDIIPNGVTIFKPINKKIARKKLDLKLDEKYILFLGDRNNERKNYRLLESAQSFCKENYKILNRYPVPHEKVPIFLNACDVLVLTSYKEGSPNVIKEAMACNFPIVSTDVGDVRWVFGEIEGCYISSFKPEDVAEKINTALKFGKRTKGRERIVELGLDAESVVAKITEIYQSLIQ